LVIDTGCYWLLFKNNISFMNHIIIIKAMKKSILFFLSFLIFACSKPAITHIDPPVVVPPSPEPTQYGTPFSGVPTAADATIYQVNMRTFSAQGNFQGVVARLDSIKALGVNVIYLMPIYPVGTVNSVNSPYCIKDYKAINTEFGSISDLRAITDGAHSRNMSVILDWVANHTAWDNAWITSNKSWYQQDASGNVVSPPNTGWNDVAQLNFSNPDMRLAMIKAMKYWVYTANIDGFRCDYSDGPPVDFWKQALDTLKNITSHKLLMLAEGTRSANFSAGFDLNFGFNFFGQLKNIYANGQSALTIDGLNNTEYNGAAAGKQVVRYITNHDVNSSDGTPLELFGGAQGSLAAFVIAAYMKSVPMIYNGQEVGNTARLTFPFTSTKINWSGNYPMQEEYKKIIAFRNSSAAIRSGTLTAYSSADVCAFTKTQGTEKVLVISNLRNSTVNYPIPAALQNTTWQDAMNGGNVTLTAQLSLQPYAYWVLKL
jgi:glycosidase